ncbi:jg3737 [Pararge aegeria aegeria]|uniref:Jg3737 protein n=1 Tax=Pararge aegeria aegeria TaxID=348720 RepID=A0A8S4QUB5_9NEOP|nr:jg3737 [Pararge aegeria aegeria]
MRHKIWFDNDDMVIIQAYTWEAEGYDKVKNHMRVVGTKAVSQAAYDLAPERMMQLASAIFIKCFVDRFGITKATSEVTNEIIKLRKSGGVSIANIFKTLWHKFINNKVPLTDKDEKVIFKQEILVNPGNMPLEGTLPLNRGTWWFYPDVVEPWGSSHGELSRSPHSPGDAVATPQVVIGKCPSEKCKKKKHRVEKKNPPTRASVPYGCLSRNRLLEVKVLVLFSVRFCVVVVQCSSRV